MKIDSLETARSINEPGQLLAHRWVRLALASVLGLGLAGVALLGGGLLWLRAATRAALPQLDGTIALHGALLAPVTVRRDGHGVPHIEAAREDDLFVAQGYVTAQDRLWQMDLLRRAARGELAEILGPAMLKHDREQRVLGFRGAAERIYSQLPAADRRRFDDYARGVNLFIDTHQQSLSPEFRLLVYRPRPWRGEDSLAVGLLVVQMLDTHWEAKLARSHLSARLNNAKLEEELYPVGSWRDIAPLGLPVVRRGEPKPEPEPDEEEENQDDGGFADERSQAALHLPAGLLHELLKPLEGLGSLGAGLPGAEQAGCVECHWGSNNWVVSGAHTASGKPMLANDMHLTLTAPNIWYMNDLKAPGYHVAGVSFPGLPFVVAGHNEHVAWGFTALFADVQDLYVEQLDGRGNYLDADGHWQPLVHERELIHVRGRADQSLDVLRTAHGPLLNPILNHESRPVSLRWTLYDTSLRGLPLYEINAANNWSEFSAALGGWNWPTQNLVYADDQGHIAYHAIGRVPLRPAGLQGKPIEDGKHEWQGYIPFAEMPQSVDPESGFLATANARVTTERSPSPLSLEWADAYRTERIYKLLDGRNGLTPIDMLAAQTDIYSEVDQQLAHRFAYAIEHTHGTDERLRKAAILLRNWDGRLSTDSAAASIVDRAREAFWPLILEPKLGKVGDEYRWTERAFAEEEIIMHGGNEWLPGNFRNWDALLTEAVRRGMENGHAPADITRWSFGSWHTVSVEHPLAMMLPVVSRVAGSGEFPLSGDTTTVKQVTRSFGPSQRFIMDWGSVDGSSENIVLGESGNPLSPYYADQWHDWYGGTTFALPFSPSVVQAQSRHLLRLLP